MGRRCGTRCICGSMRRFRRRRRRRSGWRSARGDADAPALTSVGAGDGPRATLWMGFTEHGQSGRAARVGRGRVRRAGGRGGRRCVAGESKAPVGLAHSDADGVAAPVVMVVWSAGDSRTEAANRLRWGVRALAGAAWRYGYFVTPSGDTQTGNRVAVGYDAVNEHFLVVSVTDKAEPYVIVAEADGTQVATVMPGASHLPPIHAFDVGGPVCRAEGEGSRCILPYTSGNHFLLSTARMLQPAWLELAVVGDSVVLDGRSGDDVLDGLGLMALAGGVGELRGVAGEQRFALADGAALPVVERARLTGEDWPLRSAVIRGSPGRRPIAWSGGASRRAGTELSIVRVVTTGMCRTGTAARRCVRLKCRARTELSPTDAGGGESRGESSTGAAGSSSGAGAHRLRVDDGGCGCATGGAGPLAVLLLGLRRRRRR